MTQRILQEIKYFDLDDVEIIRYDNIFQLTVKFMGPEDSLYENIPIQFDIYYSYEHPFKPPKIIFKPALFHPNIDSNGVLIVESLTGDCWSPALTLNSIIPTIQNLCYIPDVCEDLLINDKGKEELDDIKEVCANPEALQLRD